MAMTTKLTSMQEVSVNSMISDFILRYKVQSLHLLVWQYLNNYCDNTPTYQDNTSHKWGQIISETSDPMDEGTASWQYA